MTRFAENTFAGMLLAVSFSVALAQNDGDNTQFSLSRVNDPADSLWRATGDGIRGVIAGSDLDRDGRREIIATDYEKGGRVHVFEVVGGNQLDLVWSSPGTGETSSNTCRFVQTGDLDGNGREEIIVAISEESTGQNGEAGFHIFEWDGVTDNGYGTAPLSKSRLVSPLNRFRVEHFLVNDLDGDGKQEVIVPINGDGNDDYFVIDSVTGSFAAGTATWVEEARYSKGTHWPTGDPVNVLVADMDGDGRKEALFHVWNNMTVFVAEAQGPNSYLVGAPYTFGLGNKNDVTVANGAVADFDHDGKEEAYFNGYRTGNLFVIVGGSDATAIDASKVFLLSRGRAGQAFASYGMAAGDQDHGPGTDGGDLYIGSGGSADLYDFEFNGGSVTDSLNYTLHVIYSDTTDGGGFVAKLAVPAMDLDGDGRKEIVLGYQSLPDSVNGQRVSPKWLRVLEFGGSAVPVELASFTAMTQYGDVHLRWTTATERNNYGFEIQRAEENSTFRRIGFTAGKGTTTVPQSYHFVDRGPSAGKYRYRLKQRDTDGSFEFSPIVEVTVEVPRTFALEQNFPNPFNGETVISYQLSVIRDQGSENRLHVRLEIYNILGQKVRTLVDELRKPGRHRVSWDGRDDHGNALPSGLYWYRLQTRDFVATRRMVLAP